MPVPGLDPGIDPDAEAATKAIARRRLILDARVKPAHDAETARALASAVGSGASDFPKFRISAILGIVGRTGVAWVAEAAGI